MFRFIVSCESAPRYIKVQDNNLVLVDSIYSATQFTDDDYISEPLNKAREMFKPIKFVMASCDKHLIGLRKG